MITPVRIQRKRTKGYNMQAHSRAINGLPAVYVGRPTIFGNPFLIAQAHEAGYAGDPAMAHAFVTICFREWLGGEGGWWSGWRADAARDRIIAGLPDLRGKNLACWCALDRPCHADVLLEWANG